MEAVILGWPIIPKMSCITKFPVSLGRFGIVGEIIIKAYINSNQIQLAQAVSYIQRESSYRKFKFLVITFFCRQIIAAFLGSYASEKLHSTEENADFSALYINLHFHNHLSCNVNIHIWHWCLQSNGSLIITNFFQK